MFAEEAQFVAHQAVDAERAGYGDQDARVAAGVVAADSELRIPAKWQVDAKPGNDEEDDYGGGAEDDACPGVSDETSERCGGVDAGKEWKRIVVPYGYPEGKHEAEGVQRGEMAALIGCLAFTQSSYRPFLGGCTARCWGRAGCVAALEEYIARPVLSSLCFTVDDCSRLEPGRLPCDGEDF